ncbi:MAG: DmsC/YnfH family molybdoenzyme membrane anchor subunit [Ramlibacter sp.]|nr:DmsC/YnfH family molybdoenzyme membrane anchor subunit [Ramlibacter sp.]
MSTQKNLSVGPAPRQQYQWDWRAAGNFMGGGAGAGLLLFTQLSGVKGIAAIALVLGGLGLVGLGLFCVWLEIGRPLRAMNVFLNARTSWMSREALVSVLVFGLGLGLLAGVSAWAAPLAIAALAFLYCQARIVQGAKGIPTWRVPLTVPLLVLTGLAEGAGLFWVVAAWQFAGGALVALFGVLVLMRWLLWRAWRASIAGAPVPALAAIDRTGIALQWLGSAAPLALVLVASFGTAQGALSAALLTAAGAVVAATGAYFKFTLVTRGAYYQGFSLARLPVRGVPR